MKKIFLHTNHKKNSQILKFNMWSTQQHHMGYLRKIVLPDHLEVFKKWTIENCPDVNFKVSLGDAGFWMEPHRLLQGAVGWMRPVSCGGPSWEERYASLPAFDDRDLRLSLSVPGKHDLELILTNNCRGQPAGSYHTIENMTNVEWMVKKGLYKRPGFDEAFQAMKKMKPSLTEKLFSGIIINDYDADCVIDYDGELVEERSYDSDEGCVHTMMDKGYDRISLGTYTTEIQLAVSELPRNLDKIKAILTKESTSKSGHELVSGSEQD